MKLQTFKVMQVEQVMRTTKSLMQEMGEVNMKREFNAPRKNSSQGNVKAYVATMRHEVLLLETHNQTEPQVLDYSASSCSTPMHDIITMLQENSFKCSWLMMGCLTSSTRVMSIWSPLMAQSIGNECPMSQSLDDCEGMNCNLIMNE